MEYPTCITGGAYERAQRPNWGRALAVDGRGQHLEHLPTCLPRLTQQFTAMPRDPGELKFEIYREDLKVGEELSLLQRAASDSPTIGQWRWHLIAWNGQPVAHGGESYHHEADMLAILEKIVNLKAVNAKIVDGDLRRGALAEGGGSA